MNLLWRDLQKHKKLKILCQSYRSWYCAAQKDVHCKIFDDLLGNYTAFVKPTRIDCHGKPYITKTICDFHLYWLSKIALQIKKTICNLHSSHSLAGVYHTWRWQISFQRVNRWVCAKMFFEQFGCKARTNRVIRWLAKTFAFSRCADFRLLHIFRHVALFN